MQVVSSAIIIFSIVGIGFGAGMHLGLIDDSATMYKIQNLLPENFILSNGLPFFNIAFMSGQSQGLISHATVSFGLEKIVVKDEEGIPLYYDNKISECVFHSKESIDEPICIVCRIKDTHEKCVDLWMGLDEFEHGLLLNTQIPGVTVTAVANGNFPDEVMIFVSDNNNLIDDDPDLETEGVGGICTDCLKPDGEGMHIAVIPEFITGSEGDGIVDIPDDSAWGGTQTWVFDKPWFLRSFDFVDYDRNYNGEARAYTNSDCSGLVATAVISKIPNGGDGSVQTITLNANNVRCLQVEYEDSGGITNVHLECIKTHNPDDIIATGLIDLPDGYIASTSVSIPLFDGGVDVFTAQSVSVEIGKSLIDFDGLAHGDNHATISGYLLSNFGINLEIDGFNGINQAIIYDSNFLGLGGTGFDADLEHPLVPDDPNVGNLLVMKENSGNQPNDSAAGGIIRFKSVDPMTYVSIDVVDHDRDGMSSEVRTYETFDCTGPFDMADIIVLGENSLQTVMINDNNVRCLEIVYEDSGGFTNLQLGCLGAFHEKTEGCTPGFWKQSQHFDSWVDFVPGDLVGGVFNQATSATSGSTLLEALSFMGGPEPDDAEQILMRAAVAAILSATSPDVNYPSTVAEIISSVNTAIASGVRDTMLALATVIDLDNNRSCPLNGGSESTFTQTTTNDSEENVYDGSISLGSSDLELHRKSNNDGYVAMRYTGVTVPQGATIINAEIQFHVDEVKSNVPLTITFRGEDIGDSPALTSTNSDISSRFETSASVDWAVPHWAALHDEGAAQLTPDLSSIVQEIVDRGDWASGNDMTIMIKAWPDNSGQRIAESSNGESSNAPILTITFSSG